MYKQPDMIRMAKIDVAARDMAARPGKRQMMVCLFKVIGRSFDASQGKSPCGNPPLVSGITDIACWT